MSHFQVHTLETAPEASRPILEGVQKNYGFIPNLFGVFAEAPAAAEAYAAIGAALAKSRLSAAEQQVVAIAASAENGCTYCVAAHSTIAQMQKVPADVVEGLREQKPLADEKLEALRTFTISMVEKRGWVDEAEVQSFFAAGYDAGHILEVITYLALKTLSNYTNHIAETPLDDNFAAQRWEENAVAV